MQCFKYRTKEGSQKEKAKLQQEILESIFEQGELSCLDSLVALTEIICKCVSESVLLTVNIPTPAKNSNPSLCGPLNTFCILGSRCSTPL